jgi:hypothetical protein
MPRVKLGRFAVPLPILLVFLLCVGAVTGFYTGALRAQVGPPALPEGAIAYEKLAADPTKKQPQEETRASSDAVTGWANRNANHAAWSRLMLETSRQAAARRAEREAALTGFGERGVK